MWHTSLCYTHRNLQTLYDPRLSDTWSCGVILYTLLAGSMPFTKNQLFTIIKVRSVETSSECYLLFRLYPYKYRYHNRMRLVWLQLQPKWCKTFSAIIQRNGADWAISLIMMRGSRPIWARHHHQLLHRLEIIQEVEVKHCCVLFRHENHAYVAKK